MAADKCSGCQSFCMRGGQVVGSDQRKKSTDTNYDASKEEFKNYNDLKDWEQWKNFTSGANGTTICSPTGLTAISQKDLADFIKIAYNEGKFNPVKNNMFNEDQIKNKDKISNFTTLSKDSGYRFESSDYNTVTKDYENGGSITSNSIIHKEHYNGFLNQLANNSGNIVKQSDLPNGDKIRIPSNGNGGPQVAISGKTISESGGIENKNGGMDGSLITAKAYVDLAKQASKLLYHPFQCNICNVCEGGKFGEIVRELGTNLSSKPLKYSWFETTSFSEDVCGIKANGNSIRQDCSGFVGACISIYGMSEGKNVWVQCNSQQYVCQQLSGLESLFEDGASPDGSSTVHGYHKGESGHVEATDDNSNLWSAGGSGNKLPSYDSGCHERASMFGATGASRKSNSAALFHASGNVGTGGNNSDFDTDDGPLESEGDAFDSEGNWCGASEVSTDDSGGCSNNETSFCGEGTICDRCEICLVCQSCMLVG